MSKEQMTLWKMTPKQIEKLTPGYLADAEIEAAFFGRTLHRCIDGSFRSNSGLAGRKRNVAEYSTKDGDAVLILYEAVSFRVWKDRNGINVSVDVYVNSDGTRVKGVGKDESSFALAVCKAALMAALWRKRFKDAEKEDRKEAKGDSRHGVSTGSL